VRRFVPMFELIVLAYLGGFAAALFFAARERAPTTWMADFWLAGVVALWPAAAVIAAATTAYKSIQQRR
jgi:hypothetical protein